MRVKTRNRRKIKKSIRRRKKLKRKKRKTKKYKKGGARDVTIRLSNRTVEPRLFSRSTTIKGIKDSFEFINEKFIGQDGREKEDHMEIQEIVEDDEDFYTFGVVSPPAPLDETSGWDYPLKCIEYHPDTPYKCCNDDETSVKFIRAHSAIIHDPFKLPYGVKLITLTYLEREWREIDFKGMAFCEKIRKLYLEGNYLFKDDDTNRKLSDKGRLVIEEIERALQLSINPKLNLNGERVNNMRLRFTGDDCEDRAGGVGGEEVDVRCSIGCIDEKGKGREPCRNHVPHLIPGCLQGERRDELKRATLKDIILINGKGTYIVCSCRLFDKGISEQEQDRARTLSGETDRQ